MRVPDIAGEVIGWRVWKLRGGLVRNGAPLELVSLNGTAWPHRSWLEAECSLGRHHDVPGDGCSCGVYAAATLEKLHGMNYPAPGLVVGEVGLAGKVIRGTKAHRAERARPLRLYVSYFDWRLAPQLRELYLATVELSDVALRPVSV